MVHVDNKPWPRSVCNLVVEAVAAEQGTDATDLAPLYHSIDPDALENLFSNRSLPRGHGAHPQTEVRFTYEEYRVTVSSGGSIDVAPITDDGSEPASFDRSRSSNG